MWSQSRRAYTYSTDDAIVLASLDADTLMHWSSEYSGMGTNGCPQPLYTLPCLWRPLYTGKGDDIMAYLDCQLDYIEEDRDQWSIRPCMFRKCFQRTFIKEENMFWIPVVTLHRLGACV